MSFFQSFHLTSDVLIDVLQLSTRRQMALLEPLSVDFQQLIGQFFSEKPYLIFEEIYCKFGLPDEKCDDEKVSTVSSTYLLLTNVIGIPYTLPHPLKR